MDDLDCIGDVFNLWAPDSNPQSSGRPSVTTDRDEASVIEVAEQKKSYQPEPTELEQLFEGIESIYSDNAFKDELLGSKSDLEVELAWHAAQADDGRHSDSVISHQLFYEEVFGEPESDSSDTTRSHSCSSETFEPAPKRRKLESSLAIPIIIVDDIEHRAQESTSVTLEKALSASIIAGPKLTSVRERVNHILSNPKYQGKQSLSKVTSTKQPSGVLNPFEATEDIQTVYPKCRATLKLIGCTAIQMRALQHNMSQLRITAESLSGDKWFPCCESKDPLVLIKGHKTLYDDIKLTCDNGTCKVSFKILCKGPCDARRAPRTHGVLKMHYNDQIFVTEPMRIMCNRSKGGIRTRDIEKYAPSQHAAQAQTKILKEWHIEVRCQTFAVVRPAMTDIRRFVHNTGSIRQDEQMTSPE